MTFDLVIPNFLPSPSVSGIDYISYTAITGHEEETKSTVAFTEFYPDYIPIGLEDFSPKTLLWSPYIDKNTITTTNGIEGLLYTGIFLTAEKDAVVQTIIKQICTVDNYIIAATNNGLYVYDLYTNDNLAYAYTGSSFSTVAGSNGIIYAGYNGGVKAISSTSISQSVGNVLVDLSDQLYDISFNNITSSGITYLHVYNNNFVICTNSGVDYYRLGTNPEIHSKTLVSNAYKAFYTKSSLYYTSSSGSDFYLNRVDTCLTDWNVPSYSYSTISGGLFEAAEQINDFFITEGTASEGNNTVFCATLSGVYVIDEDTMEYAIYYTK